MAEQGLFILLRERNMKIARKIQVVSILALMTVAGAASAQAASDEGGYCDPKVAQALVEEYKARQRDRDETFNPLLKTVKDVAEESFADLSSCVDLSWPTMKFQYPTMDMIIRGIAKELVNKACGAARETVNKANSAMNGSYYMNTRLPGVPNIGVSYGATSTALPVPGSQGFVLPPSSPPKP